MDSEVEPRILCAIGEHDDHGKVEWLDKCLDWVDAATRGGPPFEFVERMEISVPL